MSSPRSTPDGMSRRHFLNHLKTTSLAFPAASFLGALQSAAAPLGESPKTAKRCILLWMGGGPSQMDTWSLKPGSERNGGEFRPIATSAPGVEICEHLPTVARQMKHLAIIRSLNSKEGNHERGDYLMHTGYAPNPTIIHPSFGAVCSRVRTEQNPKFDLPYFISINTPGTGAGFLGMGHSPFMVQNPNTPIANLLPPSGVSGQRMARRLDLLAASENTFATTRGAAAIDHRAVYGKTVRLMSSRETRAFSLDEVPAPIRDRYGRNAFGQGCLMARRLIEAGVSFVEVALGGWDNHQNIFDTLSTNLLPQLDKGMGTLVEDLAVSGLLDTTLIVWMGEFGRTPRVNQDSGRDHWPRSWSVVLGGAGIKGGQVVGATDADGVDVTDREVGVMDLVATMTRAMDLDLATNYTTPRGRPYRLVDGGQPISELF
jgi:hypothetical protein